MALSIDNPSGISLDTPVLADPGLSRIGSERSAFDVGQTAGGRAEQSLLLRTVRAPVGAVKFSISLRQMLCQSTKIRIFWSYGLAPYPGVMEMNGKHDNSSGSKSLNQPRGPRKLRQIRWPLENNCHEDNQQQRSRSEAVGAGRFQFQK